MGGQTPEAAPSMVVKGIEVVVENDFGTSKGVDNQVLMTEITPSNENNTSTKTFCLWMVRLYP